MDELEKELKEGFLQEAVELLEGTEQAFLDLEHQSGNPELVNRIFRFAHNLKGTSRAVGFGTVAEFTHEFENLILQIKEGKIKIENFIVTLLLECNDHVKTMIYGLKENLNATFDSTNLIEKLKKVSAGNFEDYVENKNQHEQKVEVVNHEPSAPIASSDLVLHPAALESLVELGIPLEEVQPSPKTQVQQSPVQQKLDVQQSQTAPKTPAPTPTPSSSAPEAAKAHVEETIRVGTDKINKLNDIVGELVIVQTVLNQMRNRQIENELAVKAISQLSKLTKEIQQMSMGLSLVSLKSTFQKMSRIVRDTSKALNKKVNLVIEGDNNEIDKTVLEHLSDPLVHIIRNAVDHGLETTEGRISAGKSEEGKVTLRAYYEGNSLAIEVTDDGKGIDHHFIRKKAIEKKVISENTVMTEKELVNLIFHPGFSTKEQVSEVSGRGVGMDVVKTNITRLSGKVDVTTVVGKGSVFKILLPLTLAIIDGMVVEVGHEKFVIPLDQITESLLLEKDKITSFTGIGECLNLRGEVYPLFKISQKLNLKYEKSNKDQIAIIVKTGHGQYAVVVDDILRQQQIVIKKIGAELKMQKGYMGSTILGDGKPAFILDVIEMFNKEETAKGASTRTSAPMAA